jgi:predicted tellurium resistance membrane protein TerC
MDISQYLTAENITAIIALSAMEIVLGIDNIVFIAILTSRLPESQRSAARKWGLGLALITRIGLLFSITWVMSLVKPLFNWQEVIEWLKIPLNLTQGMSEEDLKHSTGWLEVNTKDIILLVGGLFLIAKSTIEIHKKIEGEPAGHNGKAASFMSAIIQVGLLDIVFSLDSVITAVGMAKEIWVMVAAVVVAMIVMMIFADSISNFVERHPTVKMLALSFLILIGVMLVAEGVGTHINKNYIYFAMAFSLMVELLNMRMRLKQTPKMPKDGKAA